VAFSLDAATVIRASHPDQRRKIRAMVDALRDSPEIGKPLRRESRVSGRRASAGTG